MRCVYGWAGVRYVITKFSRMDSLPNFLTHGAPLRARERAPLQTHVITYFLSSKCEIYTHVYKSPIIRGNVEGDPLPFL